jgi:hypothetical protein
MSREASSDEKASVYVNCAEAWLEDEDSVNAEKYINKAAHLIHLV